jgi:hypothetical protein
MIDERNQESDEQWIRDVCTKYAPGNTVYIRRGHYDGGYEIRVGSYTFFIEYEAIDDNEEQRLLTLLQKGGYAM